MSDGLWMLVVGMVAGAWLALLLWWCAWGRSWWHEVQSWRAQQDAHERETQRWMAEWAASSSGMSREQWERTLYELQEEMHRRGGLQRDRRGVVRQREG
jgi:hypothetical protein